jgi:hypothetical protein
MFPYVSRAGAKCLRRNRMWRRRVEFESTIRPAKDRIAGFEGRGDHRTPFASGRSITWKVQGSGASGRERRAARLGRRVLQGLESRAALTGWDYCTGKKSTGLKTGHYTRGAARIRGKSRGKRNTSMQEERAGRDVGAAGKSQKTPGDTME